MSLTAANYSSHIFNVKTLDQAKGVILTQASELTTEQRWQLETPYLEDLILSNVDIDAKSLVLDFGCGVGRISKELIISTNCRCVGVDTSISMLGLGLAYVGSGRYLACAPDMLEFLNLKFDVALSIWALQHVRDLEGEIDRILGSLKPGGKLFLVNMEKRALPTEECWVDDGQDIRKILGERCVLKKEGKLDPAINSKLQSQLTFWAIYEKQERKPQ